MSSSLRFTVYALATVWYVFMAIGHQLHGSELFDQPSMSALQPELLGSYKGNYYAGTAWMAVGAYLHYTWTMDVRQRTHARRLSGVFALMWTCLGVFYRARGEPGVWGFVLVSAVVDGLCFILA